MDKVIKKRAQKGRKTFYIKPHLRDVYGFHVKHSGVQRDAVLLESFHGKTINDSSLVMAREILRLWPGQYRIYFATRDMEAHSAFIKAEGLDVTLVSINTAEYVKVLATSRYIISNASLPTYFIRRKNQTYLQTWHGTPLKTLGRKMRFGIESMYNVQHNFLQASYILQPNEFTRRVIMEDYFLEDLYTGRVIMSGYPRNQVFMQPERSVHLRESLGLTDKTVYAYMPTWRGTSNHTIETDEYFDEVKEIFDRLDHAMTDDQVMFVNFHPIIQGSLDFAGYEHIKPFPADVDNYSFLSIADCLVTDYSSVFFDYSLTGKPVILFMYDYEKYVHDRNLYMDIKTLPFRQVFDVDEFIGCITEDSALGDSYTDAEYFRTFFRYDSPDAPEKILRLILKGDDSTVRKADIESWRKYGEESLKGGDEEGLIVLDYSKNKDRKWTLYMPDHIDRESDLQTFQQICDEDENALLLFYKKWFNGRDMSQLIYDKYNRIRYIVMTSDTDPEILISQISGEQGGKSEELDPQLDYRRRYFPGISVKKMITDGYGIFRDKCQVRPEDVVLTEFTLGNYGPASLDISIEDTKDLTIKEAAVLDNKNTIIRRRVPDKSELDDLTFRFDFKDELEKGVFPNKRFASAGLICEDENGEPKLLKFTDEAKLEGFDPKHKIKRKLSYDPMRCKCMLPKGFMSRKTGFIYIDPEEDAEREEQEVCVMPVLSSDRSLNFRICSDDKLIEFAGDTADLKDIKGSGSIITVEAVLKGWQPDEAKTMVLRLSSETEDVVIPMEADIAEKNGDTVISASLDISRDIPLQPGHWNVLVIMHYAGRDYYLKVTSFHRTKEQEEYYSSIRADSGNGFTLFPEFTEWGTLRLRCRQAPKKDDSLFTKLRKFAAGITGR